MKTSALLKTGLLAAAVSLLAACGSDDSGSTGAAGATSTGVLTDAAISGVAYTTSPSNLSGTTNNKGEFQFRAGDTVSFTVAGTTLQVPALPRLTPATIAAQLFSGDAEKIANATTNLAVLFQTLDDNGDPDDGIAVDSSITLAGFTPLTALAQAPATFTGTLDAALPAGVDPVSPQEAIKHYYSNELVGSWKAATLKETIVYGGREETDVEDTDTSNNLGFLFSFDPQGNFIFSTWDTVAATDEDRRGDIAIGHVVYPEAGTSVALGGHATRRLRAGVDISATDADEVLLDPENVSVSLEGDKLVVTVHWTDDWDEDGTEDSITSVLSLNRLQNAKNSLIGSWVEVDSDESEDSTSVNADGTVSFGNDVNGIFIYYINNSVLAFVVLDLVGDGPGDEQNGIVVANYSRSGNTITIGDIKYDGVSLDAENPMLETGFSFTHGPVSADGRTTPYVYSEEDTGSLARMLSKAERSTFLVP